MDSQEEDIVLIQNIITGNQVSEKVLYNKYRKIVKDFISNKYSSYFEIDDDVSEILIKVFCNLKEYDSTKSKLRSWVLTITTNYLIDKWRCGGNENLFVNNISVTDDYTILSNSGTTRWADDSYSVANSDAFTVNSNYTMSNTNFENQDNINYISTQISTSDYNLLNLKYIQGYNYKEIGKEFNMSSSTASNKVNYIKAKLKKKLENSENE